MKKKLITVILVLIMIFVTLPVFCSGQKENQKTESPSKTETIKPDTTTPEASKTEDAIVIDSTDSTVQTATVSKPVLRINDTIVYQSEIDEVKALYVSNGYANITDEQIINQILIPQVLLSELVNKESANYSSEELSQLALALINYEATSYYGLELKTQEEFEQYVSALYNEDLTQYASEVLFNYMIQSYITENYADLLAQYEVSDEMVEDFYKQNVEADPDTFKIGPFAQLAHVFVEFGEDKAAALEKVTQIENNLKSGKITFEEACALSDDSEHTENAGVLQGYFEKDSQDISGSFGEKASEVIFSLKTGEISTAVEGIYGYHIFKLISLTPEYKVGLEDAYNPNTDVTLRDYLLSYLSYQSAENAYQAAQSQLQADLTAKASIKYFN